MSYKCNQCQDAMEREDEISILIKQGDDRGDWHNFCSWTCMMAWLAEKYAGQIDWHKVLMDP